MVTVQDPVAIGLIDSLARPGGNITGLTRLTRELSGKRLQLLTEVVPTTSRVGVLWDAKGESATIGFKEYEAAARSMKIPLQALGLQPPNPDLNETFQTASKKRVNALVTIMTPPLLRYQKQIVELAIKHRLPSIWERSEFVEAGGLVSYAASDDDVWRRAAYYADKILKGTKPADLPVEQPTKFEFVINLKTAKALNLTIPQSVLFRADQSDQMKTGNRHEATGNSKQTKVLGFALSVMLFALSSSAQAQPQQQAKVTKIGELIFRGADRPSLGFGRQVFRDKLRELGFIEGKNVIYEARFADSKLDRYPALADELVRLKVDVLVASSTPEALAFRNATKTIPVVFNIATDPVAEGLVDSLARPGGNVHGSHNYRAPARRQKIGITQRNYSQAFSRRRVAESAESRFCAIMEGESSCGAGTWLTTSHDGSGQR